MYAIGYDIGSSSIKAALILTDSGEQLDLISLPEVEMEIHTNHTAWAEQDPDTWWKYVCEATKHLLQRNQVDAKDITGVGIAYQMHGLVIVDDKGAPLRDAIIWCDSRAVSIGEKAFNALGPEQCCSHILNSPGNFTASKLRWVRENEPDNYAKIAKFMLPGDYIGYKLTDRICTTIPGLSEGIFWDFKTNDIAKWLLDHYAISSDLIPDIVPTFAIQGTVSPEGSKATGLAVGTPILYRAGDQPNNALALNVFEPGEIAATGGTSGVVYAVTEKIITEDGQRINNFAHVNHTSENPRIGKLLCINGCGIQYRWLLNNLNVSSYEDMNALAAEVPIGADGVTILPFGNGAERMLDNKRINTHFFHIDLNRHDKKQLCRAALEGIAFAFAYGIEMMLTEGDKARVIRAGNDNLFRSEIFSKTLATLTGQEIEIYKVTGAVGAARACKFHHKDFKTYREEMNTTDYIKSFFPDTSKEHYNTAYARWKKALHSVLKSN